MSDPWARRLGAVDIFNLRGHQEMRAAGQPGNGCAMVLELARRVDVERLEARLRRAAELVPELRWQLGRDRWLRPIWHVVPGRLERLRVSAIDRERDGDQAVAQLLHRPIDGREPWRIEVLRGPAADRVVLCWFHPLCDARAAARLAAWLGSDEPAPEPERRHANSDRLLPQGLRRRHELALSYFRYTMAQARRPVLSLHRAAGRPAPGKLRLLRLQLDDRESRELYRSLRSRAQLADTSIVLWASARLLDAALVARGFAPVHYLAPVPVSLDPKGDRQRMFGNHLTMMMLGLDRRELADEARAVAALARQRREIVRCGLDMAMVAALDLARVMPASLYGWAARRPFGGERASLVVSNPGELGVRSFLGCEVVDAYTAAAVLVPPGLQVIASRHGGRLSLTLVFTDGVVAPAEIAALLPALRRDLLGG